MVAACTAGSGSPVPVSLVHWITVEYTCSEVEHHAVHTSLYPGLVWVCLLTTLYLVAMVTHLDSSFAHIMTSDALTITIVPYEILSDGGLKYVPSDDTYYYQST